MKGRKRSKPIGHTSQPADDCPTHPDMRNDAPGRIPESLIDAAIDGELCEDMQREIAHALNYDPIRKQELLDTSDAINALQMPISTPDFSDAILTRADRHRRFIPAAWRTHVRVGRLGIAAGLLVTLMTVAGLQKMYPRLTTIAAHQTPVLDVEQAMEHDANTFVDCITEEVTEIGQSVASLLPMPSMSNMPGRTDQNFTVRLDDSVRGSMHTTSTTTTHTTTITHTTTTTQIANAAREQAYEIRFVGFTRGVATVYVVEHGHDHSFHFANTFDTDRARFPQRRFLAADTLGSWATASNALREHSDTNNQDSNRSSDEVDVSALP
tara:strand:+ start:57385 stop:58359 length:975 start_codon:yes stop_codon:yes gene_type:complete